MPLITTEPKPMHGGLKYRDDYVGMKFGKLEVIGYPTRHGMRRAGAYCVCECGEKVYVASMSKLLKGRVTQCAKCGRKQQGEAKRKWNLEHMKRGPYYECREERLFKVWASMKSRCGKAHGYEDVSVCDEWQDYFAFRDWSYSHGYDENAPRGACTIDRINPFGDYEPSNCRWADPETQRHNTRKNWIKKHGGVPLDGMTGREYERPPRATA